MLKRINASFDRYVLPLPVRFLTFRLVILVTILLLAPLLLYADNQVLVLGINSYLNTLVKQWQQMEDLLQPENHSPQRLDPRQRRGGRVFVVKLFDLRIEPL